MSVITKKNTLILSVLLFTVFVFLVSYQAMCNYDAQGLCWKLWDSTWVMIELLLVAVPLFLLSTVTFFLRDEVFRTWFKFSCIWVPITIILTIATPEYGDSGIISIDRGAVSFSLSVLFFVISILIILYKSWQFRGK